MSSIIILTSKFPLVWPNRLSPAIVHILQVFIQLKFKVFFHAFHSLSGFILFYLDSGRGKNFIKFSLTDDLDCGEHAGMYKLFFI